MAETRMATMVVSNMPSAPVPMFFSRLVAAISPVASMMMEPERMPMSSTTKTLMPMMPPARTRM